MSIFYLFLILIVFATAFSIYFNKKIGDTIFPALAILMIILFIMGVFRILQYSIILMCLMAFILLIYCVINIYKKNDILKDIFFNPSTLYILIVFILTQILWNNSFLSKWDEFSHWGVYVKNIFNYDSLWNSQFTSTANGYPPIVSIFQYFLMKLDGFYSEQNLFRGLFLLSTIPMVSFCKCLNFKKPIQLGLCILLILFIPSILSYDYLNSVYMDTVIGILLFAAIFNLITEDISKYNFIYCSLILSIIILTKSVGIILCGIFYIILFIDILFIRRKEYIKFYKNNSLKSNLFTLFFIGFPILFRIIWSIFLKSISVGSKLSTTLELNTTDHSFEIINNFVGAIFKNNIFGTNEIISLPSFYWIVVIVFSLLIIKHFLVKKSDHKYINLAICSVCVSSIIYTVALLFSYLYSFGSEEALVLASFERYMITILIVDIMIFILVELWLYFKGKINNKITNYLVILFVLLTIRIPEIIIIFKNAAVSDDKYVEFNEKYQIFDELKEYIDDNSKLYYISVDDSNFDYLVAQYKLTPFKLYNSRDDLCLHCEQDANRIDVEKLKDVLEEYNYIFIYNDNYSLFLNYYGSILNNKEQINNNSLYKIIWESEKINLEAISLK